MCCLLCSFIKFTQPASFSLLSGVISHFLALLEIGCRLGPGRADHEASNDCALLSARCSRQSLARRGAERPRIARRVRGCRRNRRSGRQVVARQFVNETGF